MAVGRIGWGLAPERDGGEAEPTDLGDREGLPVHGHGMPFDAAIVLEHAKQRVTPGEVLVHHAGAVDLQRTAVLAQHHKARRMVDLGIDEDDGTDRGVAYRAPRLQVREGAELRPDVRGGIEQHPVLAIPDRDRRLGAGLCPDHPLAQAGAVAAVAVPLREAAARDGAEYVYAHRGRESSWSGRDSSKNAGPLPWSRARLATTRRFRYPDNERHPCGG